MALLRAGMDTDKDRRGAMEPPATDATKNAEHHSHRGTDHDASAVELRSVMQQRPVEMSDQRLGLQDSINRQPVQRLGCGGIDGRHGSDRAAYRHCRFWMSARPRWTSYSVRMRQTNSIRIKGFSSIEDRRNLSGPCRNAAILKDLCP